MYKCIVADIPCAVSGNSLLIEIHDAACLITCLLGLGYYVRTYTEGAKTFGHFGTWRKEAHFPFQPCVCVCVRAGKL